MTARKPEHRILGDLAGVVALDAYHEAERVGRIKNAGAIMPFHNLVAGFALFGVAQKGLPQ